jgi:hypothetical protein
MLEKPVEIRNILKAAIERRIGNFQRSNITYDPEILLQCTVSKSASLIQD